MCWNGEYSCLRRLGQSFILRRISSRICKSKRTRTSRIFIKFIQYYSEVDNGTFWWNSECLMIKWSNGQRQKRFSLQIPFYVWDRWVTAKIRQQEGKVKCKVFLSRISDKRWSSNWIGVAYFPTIFVNVNFFERSEKAMKILARTPDVSRSWIGREVVRKIFLLIRWRWDFTDNKNETGMERNRFSCVQKYQCYESWHTEEEERIRSHSVQWRFNNYRSLVPNNSFGKTAQYLRSSD